MASGTSKEGFGVFDLTPHKIAICHLIQSFAPPAQQPVPFPFHSAADHNRLGLFVLSLTRSCDDFVEPQLDDLMNQLKTVCSPVGEWLSELLVSSLTALMSPDDLFNFFEKLRGVVTTADCMNVEDDQIFLDPNSHLGVFLRCCILAFNMLSFEGICHIVTNIATYCNSTDSTYELPEEDLNDMVELLDGAGMDLETVVFDKYQHQIDMDTCSGDSSTLHVRSPRPHYTLPEGDDQQGFLRSKWQVEGYLNMQADALEKDAGSIPSNSLNSVLKLIKKFAPELYRAKYLQYLNGLYHNNFSSALDNLHGYYDFTAGLEGLFHRSSAMLSDNVVGRYETALLCLGAMHSRFGHSKKALQALTEAVRVSQMNNDDSCLAYTLAAIGNLMSEIGISSTDGDIGSLCSLGTSTDLGTPLSSQQQLLVLLKRSLKRADSLKLISLVAFNHLALAKFELKHVIRPLVSFGPKASTSLRTCPASVCKELRLSSHVLSEFGLDGSSQSHDNGAFSTSWIKNLTAVTNPWVKDSSKLVSSSNDYDIFHFNAQPNPIPGSVMQLVGESYLLRATSWEFYGSAPLVRTNALVYATCFADASSSKELSLAYIKLIQHLAVFKGYKEAFTTLKLAEEKFSSIAKIRIQLLKLQLVHERALHRGHLKVAQQACDEFGVLASSVSGVAMEIKTQASLRHARTLLAAKQFSQAAAVAHSLFCTCYKFDMQVENATVLLLLAEIHKKSGNPVLGLPYALACLSFCKSFNLDLLKASATLTLAELWLSLGPSHIKRASSLLYQTLQVILGHGGLELSARANITLAKCHLSDPSFSISEDPLAVLDPLSQAAEELQILEYHEMAAEAFYLMAMVYDSLGQLQKREEAAASFREHILALENPIDEDNQRI